MRHRAWYRSGIAIAVAIACSAAGPAAAADCAATEIATSQGCATPEAAAKRVDVLVRVAMSEHHLKAVLAGFAVDGNQTLAAWGESMTGVPATPDMRFRNGAVAIAYIGTVLLQLRDAGALRLDQPLATWFPDYPEADKVTLEMLMNGTSGYADYVTDDGFIDDYHADPFRAWTPEELIGIGLARPMACDPGSCWSYAHTNFVILGRVLETVSGKPLEELIGTGIIEPLGLTGTDAAITATIPSPVLHAFSTERGRYEESTFWNPSWTIAHGAIETSTIADLLTSAAAIGEGTLVSPESHALQLAPSTAKFAPWSDTSWYGLGVFVVNGWLGQNPSFGGYAATMAYLPTRKLAIAVSVTFEPEATGQNPSTDIAKAIAAYLAPEAPL